MAIIFISDDLPEMRELLQPHGAQEAAWRRRLRQRIDRADVLSYMLDFSPAAGTASPAPTTGGLHCRKL
jgi:hypothetical protein